MFPSLRVKGVNPAAAPIASSDPVLESTVETIFKPGSPTFTAVQAKDALVRAECKKVILTRDGLIGIKPKGSMGNVTVAALDLDSLQGHVFEPDDVTKSTSTVDIVPTVLADTVRGALFDAYTTPVEPKYSSDRLADKILTDAPLADGDVLIWDTDAGVIARVDDIAVEDTLTGGIDFEATAAAIADLVGFDTLAGMDHVEIPTELAPDGSGSTNWAS